MWERTLQDLIRGLRANKKDESKFIAKVVDEIRREIKTDDMEMKAGAVLKLTYLDMLGYDMSWASFHIVEVMSSSKIHLKSVGYLAAVQSFDQDTDVLMLTTNLLKKDLSSSPADVAVTLNGVSHIVTPELARDLSSELIAMLTHSRPHIRKRAILALYKLLEKYPAAIELARTRLEERLADTDPSVVAATVNVICELARKHPADYLSLAPQLFHLLTSSSNNWMLIKIVKLFGALSPHEPRLVKKLQAPITELISTTPAVSLLYECVHTCIIGGMLQGPSGDSLARLCVSKLANFIQDADQNLKYIALLALTKIVPSHPHLVAEYQDTIMASVNDQDISIRMRALDLVTAMANRSNLQSIIQQLLAHLLPDAPSSTVPSAIDSLAQTSTTPATPRALSPSQSPAYRLVLCQRILSMCSQNTYENITNFEWYISVLVDLAYVANVDVGEQIKDQLADVVGRVRAARPYAVKVMYGLLKDDTFLARGAEGEGSCVDVLWAAAWICGEYSDQLQEPPKLLAHLLDPSTSSLPHSILAMYVQAAVKVFGHWAAELGQNWTDDRLPEVKRFVQMSLDRFRDLRGHPYIEVQERASNAFQIFTFISADLNSYTPKPYAPPSPKSSTNIVAEFDNPFDGTSPSTPSETLHFPKSLFLIEPLFSSYDLNPVASSAQENVPLPEGLDLDAWIVEPPKPATVTGKEAGSSSGGTKEGKKKKGTKKGKEKDGGGEDGDKKKKAKKSGKSKEAESKNSKVIFSTRDAEYDYDDAVPGGTPTNEEEDQEERARRKAERLAQLKDDPYYIIDEPKPAKEDVDAIPIVHLNDMPPITHETRDPRLASLRTAREFPSSSSSPYYSQTPQFEVEKEGEMPVGAVPRTTAIAAPAPRAPISLKSVSTGLGGSGSGSVRNGTPGSSHRASPALVPSTFAQYEVPDDDGDDARGNGDGGSATPELIKVVRTKKKGKKKKTEA